MTGRSDPGLVTRLLPERVRESYLLKFALATGVVLLAIGLVGYGVQAKTSETLRGDVKESLTQQTESEAASLSEFIDNRRGPVRFISDDDVFRGGTRDEIRSYLLSERNSKLSADARNVHFIDTRERRVITSTDADRAGTDVSDAPWFRWYQFGDFDDVVVTDPYEGSDGTARTAVISPVTGVFNGAVVVTYDVGGVESQFQSHVNGTFTRVVDSGGTVVFADGGAETLTPYLDDENASSAAVTAGSEGESGFLADPAVSEQRDGDYVVAFAPVEGTDWTVVKASPAANAYGVARTVENGVLLLLGIALVGVVALGATVGHSTARSVQRLSDRAAAIESGDYDVSVGSDREDEIGRLYDSIAGMRDALVDRIQEADQAQAEAEALTDQLETTANEYGAVMSECADGDLTRRLDPEVDSDAMRAVARSFNEMLDEWEETVVSIQTFADSVEATSAESERSVEEIETASSDVSEAAQTITDATQEQRERIADVSDEMSDLSATVEEITSTAATVAATADETATAGEDGREAASEAVAELEAIRERTDRAVDEVERLDDRVTEIGEVAEMIGDIAEETNVLALNANIEAARATEGGDGDGFAVVADEVKQLAEETKESAEEIESLIGDVTSQTEATVAEMREVGERVEDGTETVSEALGALDDIADKAEDTNAGVQEIRRATDQQADAAQEVSSTTDRVAEIAEDTTRETENVAAAAEEQAAQVEEMSDRIDELADRVTDLRAELDAFETDETRVEGSGSGLTSRSGAESPGLSDRADQTAVDGGREGSFDG
ncbi:methyl-accepting chemotaxis protein [Halobellus limi]|uniref:Methyl-accepting chemotaxis protein n=1 Tax=Halobellus limi TaxID=699433 RepID=A0A1H5ZWH2_9EURY|nr:methyl-accepting chemotaxis protein [Halobellus limi]QCC47914.1 methyl-accepting chemotaxis protein [Halobellus limi]SEG40502.1 Methyl-accepting chemotaxis protein [Halobellus limi]